MLVDKSHTLNKGRSSTYAPKEQIQGKILKESDLYSAGMVLCFLCGLEIEEDILLSSSMKEGKFPDISNHKNKDLLEIAFQMMNYNYHQRITLDQSKNMLCKGAGITETQLESYKTQNKSILQKEVENGFCFYEGQENGKLNGKGKYFYSNDNIYDGEWIENNRTRFGILKYGQDSQFKGDRYEGYFKDNKMHGQGKYVWANGDICDGEWIEDNRTGFGIFQNAKDSSGKGNRYEGYFKVNKRHGKGKLFWATGEIYDGEWIEGNTTGFGIFQYGQDSQWKGDRYEGYFKDSKRHGKGKYFYADGTTEEGVWKDNQKEQECRIF